MLTPDPVQTTYNQYLYTGQTGQRASSVEINVDTKQCVDGTGNGIGFGLAVSQDSASDFAASLGGSAFVGITVQDVTVSPLNGTDVFKNGENMPVANRGDWWVTPGDTVLAGGSVYYSSSTGQLGASGLTNAVIIEDARWMTSSAAARANGKAVVRLGNIAGNK